MENSLEQFKKDLTASISASEIPRYLVLKDNTTIVLRKIGEVSIKHNLYSIGIHGYHPHNDSRLKIIVNGETVDPQYPLRNYPGITQKDMLEIAYKYMESLLQKVLTRDLGICIK